MGSDDQPVLIRLGKIVLASGVLAGATAGVAGLVASGRRSSDSRWARLEAAVEPALESVRAGMHKVADDDAGKTIRDTYRDVAGAMGQHGKKRGMKRFSGRDTSQLADQVRDSAAEGKDRFGHIASDALHEAANRLSGAAEEGREARERARKTFGHQRDAAEERRKQMRQQSGERLSELEKYVAGTVEGKVKPSLAKAGESASHVAGDLRSRLSDEMERLADVAEQRRPQVAGAAESVSARISRLLKDVDVSGDEWRETAENALRDAEHVVQENANVARRVAGDVSANAKEGGKSFASLLFWLAIAGGIAYAVLMNEEQKRKSRELATATWHEGRELYRDIRGQNADFEN